MKRTFRDYARSFVFWAGVAGLSALPFLPLCESEKVEHVGDVVRPNGSLFPTYKARSVQDAESWISEQSSRKEEDAWAVYIDNEDVYIQDIGHSPLVEEEHAEIRYDTELRDSLIDQHEIHQYHSHPKDFIFRVDADNNELLVALPSNHDFLGAASSDYTNRSEGRHNPMKTIVSGRYAVDYSVSPDLIDQFNEWLLDQCLKVEESKVNINKSPISLAYYGCMKKIRSEGKTFNARRFVELLNSSGLRINVRTVGKN